MCSSKEQKAVKRKEKPHFLELQKQSDSNVLKVKNVVAVFHFFPPQNKNDISINIAGVYHLNSVKLIYMDIVR